jgi:TPP-dependent pyruvate/acetoin dehydrogenase alpha subunit
MPAKKENPRELIDLLRRMWLIRAFEEKASALYAERQIVGLLHLGIGQEAVAVGACSLLRNDDYVFGGHRSHGHAIAKGADINKLMAEIAGRASGYCGGKGGSMHIVAKETGFITATGVVGGTIPLALGAAFAAKEKKQRQVAVVFFGDGAGQAGPFHESLNIASLWRLPVIFVCENNGYAEFTPLSAHTKIERLAQHANSGKHHRWQRSFCRARRDAERRRGMPLRQRADIRRMLDPPHARPLRGRSGEVPRAISARRVEKERSHRPRCPRAEKQEGAHR